MTKRVMKDIRNIQRKIFDLHGDVRNMLGKVTGVLKILQIIQLLIKLSTGQLIAQNISYSVSYILI